MAGGSLSGHERASRLDALQSTLHGLEEVLSKRRVVDKTARVEAEALGGPAAVWSLLSDDGGDKDQTRVAASGRGEGAATGTTAAIDGGSGGWLTGSQLKAFEKNVEARCVRAFTKGDCLHMCCLGLVRGWVRRCPCVSLCVGSFVRQGGAVLLSFLVGERGVLNA